MSRWIWILLIVVAVIVIAAMMRSPAGVPVDVASATRGTIRAYVEERAKTRLPEIHRITMPQQGRILPITLSEGERVSVGQVVARMDTSDLETDLNEATNSVKSYDKNLEQLELAIQQAEQTVFASKRKYEYFEREFGRVLELFKRKSAPEAERNQAELQMIESQVDLRKDELQKEMYMIGRTIFQLLRDTEVGKQAKARRNRDRAVIRSPVAGVVLSKEVSNERVLQAGDVLLEIGNLDALEIEADVLTQDVVRVQVGDAVDIEGPTIGPNPVPGKVTRVYPQGFTKVSSLGVEQQRVKVIIAFESEALSNLHDNGYALGSDYRLRVKLYTDQQDDAVIIPRAALFRSSDNDWRTYVVQNGTAKLQKVEVGLKNDFEVQIVSGIGPDDQVVIAPDSSLADGQVVIPQDVNPQPSK